jgi:hypothetical protein
MTARNWAKHNSRALMQRRGSESISGAFTTPFNQAPRGPSHSARLRPEPRTPKLPEPVIVAEFWANRRGESVRIQLREFEGLVLVDIRKHYTAADGRMLPTKKGLSIAIARLPDLARAIGKAVHKAQELGLLSGGGES